LRNWICAAADHILPGAAAIPTGLSWFVHAAVRVVRAWWAPGPIQVLVNDRSHRRAIERDLTVGLRRLRRALGQAFPSDVVVVVQRVICTDRQLAGCYQLARRPDGVGFALIRLALQVDGRQIPMDEVLSVLAEQCIGLAVQQAGAVGLLVPIELESTRGSDGGRIDAARPDPLAPIPPSADTHGGQMRRAS
jgi:hypothetical protein